MPIAIIAFVVDPLLRLADGLAVTWFGIFTRQALRRGNFENVRALTAAIERFTGAGP